MGVAGEIGEHALRPAEGLFGINHPLGLAQWREEGSEGSRLGERGVVAEEREASGLVGSAELAQEQSPEQARENLYRQKEPGRHDTQRVSSREMPPPGTIMCTCG
jgi:hypothetical protein